MFIWFSFDRLLAHLHTAHAIYLVRRVVVALVLRFDLVYLGNWKIYRNDSGKLNRCIEHKLICRMKCIASTRCRLHTRTKPLFYSVFTFCEHHIMCIRTDDRDIGKTPINTVILVAAACGYHQGIVNKHTNVFFILLIMHGQPKLIIRFPSMHKSTHAFVSGQMWPSEQSINRVAPLLSPYISCREAINHHHQIA